MMSEAVFVITDEFNGTLINRRLCSLFGLVPSSFEAALRSVNPWQASQINATLGTDVTPKLLEKYSQVFDVEGSELRPMNGPPAKITLKENVVPFRIRTPRPIPIPLREKTKALLKNMQMRNIIEPVTEATDWVHPMSIQTKPNGELRLTGFHEETEQDPLWAWLSNEASKDPIYRELLEKVSVSEVAPKNISAYQKLWPYLSIYNGLVLFHQRAMIPSNCRKEILALLHAPHQGNERVVSIESGRQGKSPRHDIQIMGHTRGNYRTHSWTCLSYQIPVWKSPDLQQKIPAPHKKCIKDRDNCD
ncbi:hypothetical protein TCAL_13678, partial [Tigriopus californicus]|eukprot:TCALIF_13678-PA protein Name:"Protein of unknown function" AED:0.35 eAED:0.53 QI:65/0/0/1/0/0/4/0/303